MREYRYSHYKRITRAEERALKESEKKREIVTTALLLTAVGVGMLLIAKLFLIFMGG